MASNPPSVTSPQPSTLTNGATTTDTEICHKPVSKKPGHVQPWGVDFGRCAPWEIKPGLGAAAAVVERGNPRQLTSVRSRPQRPGSVH